MASQKQIAANRANAKLSTGPKTADGKRRSKLKAFRHGLTGQVMVAYGEDLDAYDAHCQVFVDHYRPEGLMEKLLVQQLADAQWRLNRAAAIDTNLFGLFDSNDPYPETGLGKTEAFQKNMKNLSALTLYEQRLQGTFERLLALLKGLQDERAH